MKSANKVPGLYAVLIARNNSTTIHNTLESITPVCSGVVVLDTGSTDNTAEICNTFGCYVVEGYTFNDNFAEARNVALKYLPSDCHWVLSIDTDETLTATAERLIQIFCAVPDSVFSIEIPMVVNQYGEIARMRRLFRNLPGVKWKNWLHEMIESDNPKANGIATYEGKDLYLEHSGYRIGRTKMETKVVRNLSIAAKWYAETGSKAAYLWASLAMFDLADYATATKMLNNIINDPEQATLSKNHAYNCLAQLKLATGEPQEALELANVSLLIEPNQIRANYLVCCALDELGQLATAKKIWADFVTMYSGRSSITHDWWPNPNATVLQKLVE